MAGYGAQRGGEENSLTNVCAWGKNKTRARNATGAVSFGGHERAADNEIRSVRLAFPWEFFSAAVFECAKYTSGSAASLPLRLHPHLIFLVSLLRAALPLSLLYKKKKKKKEKREIKKCTRDVSGSQSDQINVVIWLLVNRGSDCCRLGFFLLAKTKQIIGSNLVDLFDYCSDFEAFPALLQPRMQIKITMVCGEIISSKNHFPPLEKGFIYASFMLSGIRGYW